MKLYTTANISIVADDREVNLRKLKSELNEALEDAANGVLSRFGIKNDEVWTVLVDEIDREDDEGEGEV